MKEVVFERQILVVALDAGGYTLLEIPYGEKTAYELDRHGLPVPHGEPGHLYKTSSKANRRAELFLRLPRN